MNITHSPFTFQHVARILELKTLFEEYVPKFNLPKPHKKLTPVTAKWFMESGDFLNKDNKDYEVLLSICKEYDSYANVKFLVKED